MTKNRFNRNCLSTITLAALLLAAPMAYAQKGSRLCGWTADLPPGAVLGGKTLPAGGKMGLLQEAREKDASYKKRCSEVIKGVKAAIDANPELKAFPWTEVNKQSCEKIGADFLSDANKNVDMCDYMEAKQTFTVVKAYNSKQKTAASTNYTKL